MRNYNMTPMAMVNIYRLREEHERVMAMLVISVGMIQMEAALEDRGCLPAVRCLN